MFNRKYLSLFTICFMLLSQNSFPQIILQGVVTDNGAEYLGNGSTPVANALVTLTDQADDQRTFSGYTNDHGEYSIRIITTGVDHNNSHNPACFNLLQNYPNPFNPSTVIGYELNKPSYITIEIYNVLGQKIRILLDGFQSAGLGQVTWDAANDLGQGVPAGLYIYSLKADGFNINKKMLLVDGQQGSANVVMSHSTGKSKTILNKQMSDQYLLQVTGNDFKNHEQQNVEITGNMTLDITVIRTVTDVDGNVYRTVKIGAQWWMAENLKVTHYRNGDEILHETADTDWRNLDDTKTGAYCAYYNNENTADTYGYLYNWYAVSDNRIIAPEGWHVPTDDEWKELEMYLGMSQSMADAEDWRGIHNEGGKLKERGTAHWNSPNESATNQSGFSALPGGYRGSSIGSFANMGKYGYFWSATNIGSLVWTRILSYFNSSINRHYSDKKNGFSVCLIRD